MVLQMEEKSLTNEILFFDNDCISAFLWVDESSIITQLYGCNVAIPTQVYKELSAGRGQAKVLKYRIDIMLEKKEAFLVDMETNSPEFELYQELSSVDSGGNYIGRGEAACIALAKERNGILASNNLKDVKKYIDKYNLKHTTTADILVDAYNRKILSYDQIEEIWSDMILKRRKLGATSFKEYLNKKG